MCNYLTDGLSIKGVKASQIQMIKGGVKMLVRRHINLYLIGRPTNKYRFTTPEVLRTQEF